MKDLELFIISSFAINLTPGNNMIYVAMQSTGGLKRGLGAATGVLAGCLVYAFLISFSLGRVIIEFPFAILVIKGLGAAYLFFTAVQLWTARYDHQTGQVSGDSIVVIIKKGFITALLNPAVPMLLISFLMQFIDVRDERLAITILMAGIFFNATGVIVNLAVGTLFSVLTSSFRDSKVYMVWQSRIAGGIMVVLAVRLLWP